MTVFFGEREARADGSELIRAKQRSPKRFAKLVDELRKKGVTDTEIVTAMVTSPLMIDRLGKRK